MLSWLMVRKMEAGVGAASRAADAEMRTAEAARMADRATAKEKVEAGVADEQIKTLPVE